ncbi:MAG: ABC transporter permease [Cardiobacteriaceae bacterium]|nr:ABC transporter permease [Cardiobacteriaceae bacterium]
MKAFKRFEFILGASLLLVMGGLVLFAPVFFPDGGKTMNFAARLTAPFHETFWLGTDTMGRDVLARVATGGKVSFIVGVLSALGAVSLGTVVGLLAGYYRGWWDTIFMRLADIQLGLPFILMAMTIIAIIGPGLWQIVILMMVAQWVQYARLIRGAVLSLREAEYVLAAKSYGLSNVKIMFRHILPNALGPLIILMTLNVANNILLESSLTFLGLGLDPLTPSWGGMLADGRNYIQTAPWVTIFPGLAIMFTVLGLNLLGDWLRDYLDPLGRAEDKA